MASAPLCLQWTLDSVLYSQERFNLGLFSALTRQWTSSIYCKQQQMTSIPSIEIGYCGSRTGVHLSGGVV